MIAKKIRLILVIVTMLFTQFNKALAHLPPVPEFSATELCFGDTSFFLNQSVGGVYSTWVIQKLDTILNDTLTLDSIYTTDLYYYFATQGTYLVTLQEDNGHIVTLTKQIDIGNNTKAQFDFQRCTNNFISMSTCATSYFWNFGDGSTSNYSIDFHQYADTGSYVVTLIVQKGTVSDTLVKQIHVDIVGYANPQFLVTVSHDTAYCKIFGGTWSEGNFSWYFPDGTTALSSDTFHIFPDSGSYMIRLRAWNGCGIFMKDTTVTTPFNTAMKEVNKFNSNIIIFPNPTNDFVTIKLESEEVITDLQLFNLMGQKIDNFYKANQSSKIDVSNLEAGQYILQIKTKNNLYHKKIIKQ